MTRFLLKLSLILVAAFAVFNVAARAFGTLQPPNPALAGFTDGCEDKQHFCWYGARPSMTVEEIEKVWRTESGPPDNETLLVYLSPAIASYWDSDCTGGAESFSETGGINNISIRCENLLLGELILAFGPPRSISLYFFELDGSIYYPYMQVLLKNDLPLNSINPFLKVDEIVTPIKWGSTGDFPCWYWLGFTSKERYMASESPTRGECR